MRRAYYPAGIARQMLAVIASGDRRQQLRTIAAPTLVIHGAADPLVPLAAGRDTAQNIPGAELLVIEGMGHDFPEALMPRLATGHRRSLRQPRRHVAGGRRLIDCLARRVQALTG